MSNQNDLDGTQTDANAEISSTFDWVASPTKPLFTAKEPTDNKLYDLSSRGSEIQIQDEIELGANGSSENISRTGSDPNPVNSSNSSLLGREVSNNMHSLYQKDQLKHNLHVNPASSHAYHSQSQDSSLQVDPEAWRTGTSYSVQNYESSLRKYGFCPTQLPQLQALMGDPSDNIPGIKGIGPMLATKLISMYGDINNVLQIAALFMGYDSVQTQVLIDRTFARRQYQQARGIDTTLGNNDMNVLFNPLDCRPYQKVQSGASNQHNPIILDTSSNSKTMKRVSKKQALLDMAQRQQMALSLDWPLSTKLTQQLLNNLDALFISLSLVTMRQDLKLPSPKHTLYSGTDMKHLNKVFNQYNMFAMTDELNTLSKSNKEAVLKGAYNGEYGELLLDAGLYLHQVRQGMGVKQSNVDDAETQVGNEGKEGFLSYSQNIPYLPATTRTKVSNNYYNTSTPREPSDSFDDRGYYSLHHLRAKKQFLKTVQKEDKKKDIIFTDYQNTPKYALDQNLLKIAENSFYRPTYATYGMGTVDGKYNTSYDPYVGIMNVHKKVFASANAATIPNNHYYTPHPAYKLEAKNSPDAADIDLNLPQKMKKSYIAQENLDTTKFIQDKWGNTVLYLPHDIHKQFVFNLDENSAEIAAGNDSSLEYLENEGNDVRLPPKPSLFASKIFQPTKSPRFSLISRGNIFFNAKNQKNNRAKHNNIINHIFKNTSSHSSRSFSSDSPTPPNDNFDSKPQLPIQIEEITSATKKEKTAQNMKSRPVLDEFGGLNDPPLTLISRDTGEQFNFFVDIEEDHHDLPEAHLSMEHYQRMTQSSRDDDNHNNHNNHNHNGLADSGGEGVNRVSRARTTKNQATQSSNSTIYKEDEQAQDSIISIPKAGKKPSAKKNKGSNSLSTSGIVLNSVAPRTLVELPLSVVVHGILSNINAGVDIEKEARDTDSTPKERITVTNAHHPGCTVVRGLFSTIVIGQEKPGSN
jgi:5'-3' exonuclease